MTFGYGIKVSLLSAIIAAFFLIPNLSTVTALLITLFFFIPSLFLSWLMGLAQIDRQKGVVIWYPLSPALFQLALTIAIATIAVMLYILSSVEVTQYIDKFITRLMIAIRESYFYSVEDQAIIEQAIRLRFISIIASILPFYGLLCHTGTIYFAMRLANKIGYLQRPLDDWPTALHMPPVAFFIFAVDWMISPFIKNATLAICMAVIVSALSTGFMIAGLAVIHKATRGFVWRPAVLFAIYGGFFTLILTPLITIGLIIIGLFTTTSNRKIKPSGDDHFT